ncbi:MAG: LysE family translocator [Kordiimonadaceae bacterium]|nr:LysE family translocator [Kordiimonadaceae bacterium]
MLLPPADLFGAFLLASFMMGITPGPDMTYVIASAARKGMTGALIALTGISLGCMVHLALATAGVTALLAAAPKAFTILKYIGAAYLLYIAYQMLTNHSKQTADTTSRPHSTYFSIARRGLFINLLNPKLGLFFVTFLPQFIDPLASSVALQTLLLGLIFVGIGLSFMLVAAYFTVQSSSTVANMPRVQRLLRFFTASLLGGFAVRLAVSEL